MKFPNEPDHFRTSVTERTQKVVEIFHQVTFFGQQKVSKSILDIKYCLNAGSKGNKVGIGVVALASVNAGIALNLSEDDVLILVQ